MALRFFSFAVWACLGAVLTYGSLYAFTPFGLALIAAVVVVGLVVRAIHASTRAEMIGLAAGPGIFFVVVAASIDSPALAAVGAAIVVGTTGLYLTVMRRRCTGVA